MSDSKDGNGDSGFIRGILGRIPSQQVKIEEKTETQLLLKQFRATVLMVGAEMKAGL